MNQIERLTGDAVTSVFQKMLSMELTSEAPVPLATDPAGQIASSVGFIGDVTGVVYLHAGAGFAKVMTARMLGIQESEVDGEEMVNDAIGELANMVGGTVKSGLSDAGWPCKLTIPSIVRGQQLSIGEVADVTRKANGFRTGNYHLLVELLIKESSEV